MADKSVVDATLVGDSCDKTTADSDVTQALIDIEEKTTSFKMFFLEK